MTVQIVEIAGQMMAMLPVEDYERLLDIAEDKADATAAANAEARRSEGEEYIPAAMVDRLLAGESALKIWRQHRAMTLKQLSEKVGVSVANISQIENGDRLGKPAVWRALADALDVTLEDIVP